MSFDVVNFSLAAALATNGTVTVGYPGVGNKGDYADWNSGQHVFMAGQNEYRAPFDFSLTFNANASNITLTYLGATTLPAGTACAVQIERRGYAPYDLNDFKPKDPIDQVPAFVQYIGLGSPNALNASGICASQSSVSKVLLLNGTGTDVTANPNVSQGGILLDTPRNVTAAWTTTSVLTVKGFDTYGNPLTESSASGTSFTGKKAFATITGITVSADVTSCTVGYGDVLGLPIAIHQASQVLEEIFAGIVVGRAAQKQRLPFYFNQVDLLAGNPQPLNAPFAGTITNIYTQVSVAITTGGTIVVKDGSTSATGTTTIANSAAALAQQTVAITATNTVAKGDALTVVPASFATAGALGGWVEITPSNLALASGTLVLADQTLPSATTGDTRGTYKPEVATDGTSVVALVIVTANPNDYGYLPFPATTALPSNAFAI